MKDDIKYTSLRDASRLSLKDMVPLRGPLSIYLEVTNVCNFKCVFCPESFSNYKEISGGHFRLSTTDYSAIIEQISELRTVKTLNFYMMGEPFAHPQLLSFVKLAKEINASERIIVTSNGSLIKERIYREICESKLDYLRISIYGANEDKQIRNTQSKISLSKIRDNISKFKEFRDQNKYKNPFIYIKMIDSGYIDDNQEFIEYFSNVGDQVAIEPVMNWNDPEEGRLTTLDNESLQNTDYFSHRKKCCPFPFYTLVIHSDLKVSVCCVDWNKKTIIGDLKRQSLDQIWLGEPLREFQLKHIEGRRNEISGCKNCTFIHTAPDNLDDLKKSEFLSRIK